MLFRSKLEFTFSTKSYIPREKLHDSSTHNDIPALGFHAPRIFDKVIDITNCHLMDDVNNRLRNTLRDYAKEKGSAFYDIKNHTGWLRNLIVRYTTTRQLMVNLCLGEEREAERVALLDHLLKMVPEITTLLYTKIGRAHV